MSKRITVEELAANLREHLAEVEAGEWLIVVEDEREIAVFKPPLTIRDPGIRYPFRGIDFGERPKNLKTDPAEIIIEEREHERTEKKWRP